MLKKRFYVRAALLPLLCVFLLLLTVKNSEIAANGVKKGILLVTNMLAPALFPFLVLSELIVTLDAASLFSKYLARPARALFGLSPTGTSVLLLGFLCGVPVGAVSATTMLKNGKITKAEFDRLLLFANTPSTGFLIGAVGAALFESKGVGVALYFITLLSAILAGIFLKIKGGNLPVIEKADTGTCKKRLSLFSLITAIRNGFSTLLGVAGFVLFFAAITECVLSLPHLSPLFATLLCGVLELTAGTTTAVTLLTPEAAFLTIAFFAGFSGLSIAFQVLFIAEGTQPKPFSYLLARLAQGGLSLTLAFLYLKLATPKLKTAAQGFADFSKATLRISPLMTALIALSVPLLLFLLVRLLDWRAVRFEKIEK